MTDDAFPRLLARFERAIRPLPDKPEETPLSTARALWFMAAGAPRSAVAALAGDLPMLDAQGLARLDALTAQRLAGVPLAHLTGRQHFLGIELIAGADALVPRRETELLARTAIELAQSAGGADALAPITVVDACTGCGNVALAIAHHVPAARVHGADISEDAVALARRNADMLGLGARAQFLAGDLLAPFDTDEFRGGVDLVTCNPPYISSAKVAQMAAEIAEHEPRLAFDGGPFGVSILMRLVQDAPRLLRPGGWLVFEVGLGQGPALARRVKGAGAYHEVRELADRQGSVRAVAARC